jgi:spore maturation protein CgeB
LAALASRKIGLYSVNTWISKLRISVPPEEENQLYSSAKICLNVHERAESIKTHVILNERTFKVPACGGFEICDFVPPVRRYFTEQEMVMADDKHGDWVKDWFKKIDYYLAHDKERKEIKARGIARAHKDHMYTNRVRNMIGIIEDRVAPTIAI